MTIGSVVTTVVGPATSMAFGDGTIPTNDVAVGPTLWVMTANDGCVAVVVGCCSDQAGGGDVPVASVTVANGD